MSFKDLVGQEAAATILQDELAAGRINHAYLFLGRDGLGKKALALEFAAAINCQDEELDGCGECLACRKIEHGNHPDVQLLEIEDGATIKIDQIRELQHDLAYKPYESSHKIYIIDQAGRMTLQAANSLLKTLEEPPDYAVIILLAEELNNLLPTVISRCQRVTLQILAPSLIKGRLIKSGLNEERAELVSRLADGSPGRAFRLAEDEEFMNTRQEVLDLMAGAASLDTIELFKQADRLADLYHQEGFPLFDLILSWYRDIIVNNQGNREQLVNYDYQSRIKYQQDIYTIEELMYIIELVQQTRNHLEANVKEKLAFQVLLFKIRARRFHYKF